MSGLVSAQTSKPAAPAGSPATSGQPSAAASSGITAPTDPNKVVLEMDGEKMTAAQFDEMLKAFPPQVQQAVRGPQRRQFIDQYVQIKIAAKEAERRKLGDRPDVKQQILIQRDQVLAGALYKDFMDNAKVTDADVQKYYDEHKSEFETAKAHHILIRFKGSPVPLGKDKKELTDEEALAKAKEAQKRLAAGEDFEKVAKEMSDDTGTPNGGDLGSFTKGQMVGPFDQAVFSLPVGKVSDPVKTTFGYHIIRVDSRETKPLADVRASIEQKLKPEMARKELDDLKTRGGVTIDETFFKAAGATPGPTR